MKGKIIAGVTAVAVIGGGIAFGVMQNKNNGNEKLGQEISSVQEVKKENMIYPHYDSEKKLYGYIDIQGNYVIEPKFSFAQVFDENMTFAIVNGGSSGNDDKVGVIDGEGNYIIEPKYYSIYLENNKYFILDEFTGNSHYYGLADIDGNMLIDIDTNQKNEIRNVSENGLLFIEKDSGNGYYNLQGEKVISVYSGDEFKNGYAVAQKEANGLYGIINENGEWVVEPFAKEITPINQNGYAGYTNGNNEWGIVNVDGNKTGVVGYGFRMDFSDNGLAFACLEKDGKKYGIINEQGEFITEAKFDTRATFNKNGIAMVEENGKYGTIDEKGNYITEPIFDNYDGAASIDNGYVVRTNMKFGVVGADGKILIEPF